MLMTILIGFIVGLVAKFLTPGKGPGGFILTTILGILGSIVFTYLGQMVGLYKAGQGAGFIGSLIGAIALVFVYEKFFNKKS